MYAANSQGKGIERLVHLMRDRPNKALQRTAAPLGSQTVRKYLLATVAADRAFPAAVDELGR